MSFYRMAKQICIIFRLSHNLSYCCTHSTSKAATKESTNNHLYRKSLHRLLACNVACVRTCGSSLRNIQCSPQDQGCPTWTLCCCAQCPGPEGGVRSRAGSADLTGGFKCLYATGCTTMVCPPRHQPPVWCAPFVAQLWCPHRLRLPTGSLLGRLKPILFLIQRIWSVGIIEDTDSSSEVGMTKQSPGWPTEELVWHGATC